MTLSIHTETVRVANGDLQIDAYLARPLEGSYPGIVVFQEIFGVNDHIRSVTDRIAREGYVAIAPALYQRTAPGFEIGYEPDDFALGKEYKAKTTASELLSDTEATIAYLKSLPSLKEGAIGSIGFCFGGHVAYLTATLPEIQAIASFYGAGIATMCPGETEPTIARTKDISGTLYAFFGNEDASIPTEQVDRIEAELSKHNVAHKIFRYDGAGHGFFCDRRSSYNAEAAHDAWGKAMELFATVLNSMNNEQ